MTFAAPDWLWALAGIPVLLLLEARAVAVDRQRTALFVSRALWTRVVVRPAEAWRQARLVLLTVGAIGLALALARPQWGIVREKIEREGVDVVLVLDTSGSMATADAPPSRFFLAKAALLSLVSRLPGDRFGLLAFEGEAFPLVPLTLDADAVGLFLDTLDPGVVPSPGTSVGSGLSKGLDMFVDKERRNKVMVLVSDGEDLEGDVEDAIRRAKDAGVVVHTVGVGTEKGEPVPDVDRDGRLSGFKKHEDGSVVISCLHPETLEAIARGTGGRFFRITPADTSLTGLAGAIEGMEQKTLAREFSYRKKERFQVPLAAGLACLSLALLLPLPRRRDRRAWRGMGRAAAGVALALLAPRAWAEPSRTVDELLLRPRRLTERARRQYDLGNHPAALQDFEEAARRRPDDPRARFNRADALYKSGRGEEAEAEYRALGADARSPVAGAARYNLGNALYQKEDYAGAVGAYHDALRAQPGDADTRHNLELALRALRKQEAQQKQQPKPQPKGQPQGQQGKDQPKPQPSPNPGEGPSPSPSGQGAGSRPKTEEQKEQERFQRETGMPKERAMQLLDALQQAEKAEQKKQIAARPATKRKTRDW